MMTMNIYNISLYVCGFFLIACGSNAEVPGIEDAGVTPDSVEADADLCGCPTGDLLAEHLHYHSETYSLPNLPAGMGWGCTGFDENAFHLSGGCIHSPIAQGMSTIHSGYFHDPEDGWVCYWDNSSGNRVSASLQWICVDNVATKEVPAGCDCPPVEPFRDRVYAVITRADIVPYQVKNTVEARCDPGSVFLAGGCFTTRVSDRTAKMTRGGFDFEDPDKWVCAWKQEDGDSSPMEATVMCMVPASGGLFAAETQPIADRVVRVEQMRDLPGNALVATTAPCPAGATILSGSCMINSNDPLSYYPDLSVQGYDDILPNAWRCGWYNPTNMLFSTTTTAICLLPPAAP